MMRLKKLIEGSKAVFFDMDGVLIDSLGLDLEVVNKILKKRFNKKVPKSFIKKIFAYDIPTFWEKILQKARVEYKKKDLLGIITEYELLREETKFALLPGVKEILKYLKREKFPLYVVSNNPIKSIEKILQQAGIASYFVKIIGTDHIAKKKPVPDIYQYALTLGKIAADEVVVFEDSAVGVESAQRAGIKKVVGISSGGDSFHDLNKLKPYLVVKNLTLFPIN